MPIFDNDLYKASRERLWSLIAERRAPGADVDAIDASIWSIFGDTRAVLMTDLAGFTDTVSRRGIVHFLQVILEHRQLLLPIIAQCGGVMVKEEADSLMVVFARPETALACAVAMQRSCAHENKRRVDGEKFLLCVGIGYGPVLRIGDDDIYGAEVNTASKLGEDAARAGEILVTEAAREAIGAGAGDGISFAAPSRENPLGLPAFRVIYSPA